MFNLDLRIAGHLARPNRSARRIAEGALLLPPDSLPSGNQYLQFQNLFTSDSDERVAWTGVRSMALTRNARLRVRSRGIRFSELVGRPLISEPLVLLALGEQNMSETKPISTERQTLHIVNPPQVAFATVKEPEPFVSAEQAARFLSVKRRQLLALARRGLAGAYPLGTGTVRKVWVFRLSELADAVEQHLTTPETEKRDTIRSGSSR